MIDAFSSCLWNRDEAELRWPGVQQLELREKCHMTNTGRGTTCWVAWCNEHSSAATLRAQHEEIHGRGSKGRLLCSGSSQAVKQSSCCQATTTCAALTNKSTKAFQLTVISCYGTLLSLVQRSAFLLEAWGRNKSLAYSSGGPSWPRIPWHSSRLKDTKNK